ncbi:hypothetical protein Pfo_011895 [Paulownia fortunei]|nr:hypothetical protein Pfo_011895 [Paulownia fortunei]
MMTYKDQMESRILAAYRARKAGHPEGQARVPLTSVPTDQQPAPVTHASTLAPQSPPSNLSPPTLATAPTTSHSRVKRPAPAGGSSSGPPQRPRLNAPASLNASFFTNSSVLETRDGNLCAEWLQEVPNSVDQRLLGSMDYDTRVDHLADHASKAILYLSSLMADLRSGLPSSKEEELKQQNEDLQQRLQRTQARTGKLEADLDIAKGKHDSLVETIAEVERDRNRMEHQMLKAIEEASIFRAEGYAVRLLTGWAEWAQEKAKFLQSSEFLDHLTSGALEYLIHGFTHCLCQVKELGYTGPDPIIAQVVENVPPLHAGSAPATYATGPSKPPVALTPSLEDLSAHLAPSLPDAAVLQDHPNEPTIDVKDDSSTETRKF